MTRAQAVRFAQAVNLTGRDVPDAGVVTRSFQTGNGPPLGPCTVQPRPSARVAALESAWFARLRGRPVRHVPGEGRTLPVQGMHSVVYVLSNPGLAGAYVQGLRKPDAAGCVQRLRISESTGVRGAALTAKAGLMATSLPFPVAHAGGYWIRVQGTDLTVPPGWHTRPPFYEDTFAFAVGPAVVVLHADAAPGPVPAGEERRLVALLRSRADAHALR